jgi:hypothetical protein
LSLDNCSQYKVASHVFAYVTVVSEIQFSPLQLGVTRALGTVTSPSAGGANVSAWPSWIHIMLSLLIRVVVPIQQILEDCARVVKVVSPATPIADLSE